MEKQGTEIDNGEQVIDHPVFNMTVEVLGRGWTWTKGEWVSAKNKPHTRKSPKRHPCKQITVHLHISKTSEEDQGPLINKLNRMDFV